MCLKNCLEIFFKLPKLYNIFLIYLNYLKSVELLILIQGNIIRIF